MLLLLLAMPISKDAFQRMHSLINATFERHGCFEQIVREKAKIQARFIREWD